MKNYFLTAICLFLFNITYAQYNEAPYRLFGEISTVENITYRGFITWGGIKNYWIDFFEASQKKNPYASFFSKSDEVFFYNNGQMFATPPVHVFCCRFGNISSIRPTDEKEILLQLKNGKEFTLIKGNSADIHTNVQIHTTEGKHTVKWDHISEVRFMPADTNLLPPGETRAAGIVESSQGIYKGLITWNYSPGMNPKKYQETNDILLKIKMIRLKNLQGNRSYPLLALRHPSEPSLYINCKILEPIENVLINMPNVGSVIVPLHRFESIEIIPISQLDLLSYNDFKAPMPLNGVVITRNNNKIAGTLAYDLDENSDIDVLDGKNNNIAYQIPFKYIRSIDPKNYKFSFITLKKESQLSLGEAPDVNRENSGIIVFKEKVPFYIPWSEVKSVILD